VCQKKINEEFEQYCLRQLLGPIRAHFKRTSAKRRRSLNNVMPVDFAMSNGAAVTFNVPSDQVPVALSLPVLPAPAILYEVAPDAVGVTKWWFLGTKDVTLVQRFGAVGVVPTPFKMEKFARFLAKIAHATAMSMIDPESFRPLLNDCILGNNNPMKFVGGSWDDMSYEPKAGSKVELSAIYREYDRRTFIAGEIKLFCAHNSPVYLVVIGEATEKWLKHDEFPDLMARF
jgi:hypothetical protein